MMKMFRKLFFVMAVAACAASCLGDDPNFTSTYTMDTTFEYGAIFRSDSLYFDNQGGLGLGWEDMAFYHKLNDDKSEFLGGFMLSRLKGSGTSDQDRFRVNSGAGMSGSSTYIVYYSNQVPSMMPEKDIEFVASKYGTCTMLGCYVNNTKEVVKAVNEKFADGDRLAIKMTGYREGKATGEQEFVLAEFTEQKDSLVTTWSPFKLDKLGSVEYIDIEIMSTRNDIPAAFCMDDMFAKIAVSY